ncbi:hypothetical protein FQA39_LY13651 [Lamprigera yunnana]|nr:hypothetical protein FQA39_LY13651 [Lamprigera yunnana]
MGANFITSIQLSDRMVLSRTNICFYLVFCVKVERKNKLPKIDKLFNQKTDQTDEPSTSRTATTSYSSKVEPSKLSTSNCTPAMTEMISEAETADLEFPNSSATVEHELKTSSISKECADIIIQEETQRPDSETSEEEVNTSK